MTSTPAPIVLVAPPPARRRATWALLAVPAAVAIAAALPRWWTIGLAVLAGVQVPAEAWWVRTARLTLAEHGLRWDAPLRGFDVAWSDLDAWRLRRIGVGGPSSTEWMLTVHTPRRRAAVRAFVWQQADDLRHLAPRLAALAGDRGLPDGWPSGGDVTDSRPVPPPAAGPSTAAPPVAPPPPRRPRGGPR